MRRRAQVLVAAALLLAIVNSSDACAAAWLQLAFTAPADVVGPPPQAVSGVARYRVEAWSGARWDTVQIYRAPGVAGVPVAAAGTRVTLYVSQSTAAATSRSYRVAAIDSAGNVAGPSNQAVWATGFPDTIVGLTPSAAAIGNAFRRTYAGPVGWAITRFEGRPIAAVHYQVLQSAAAPRLCLIYGYWYLRGLRMSCP